MNELASNQVQKSFGVVLFLKVKPETTGKYRTVLLSDMYSMVFSQDTKNFFQIPEDL